MPAITPPTASMKASPSPTPIPAFAPAERGSESAAVAETVDGCEGEALPVAVAATAGTIVEEEEVEAEEVVVVEAAADSPGKSD